MFRTVWGDSGFFSPPFGVTSAIICPDMHVYMIQRVRVLSELVETTQLKTLSQIGPISPGKVNMTEIFETTSSCMVY